MSRADLPPAHLETDPTRDEDGTQAHLLGRTRRLAHGWLLVDSDDGFRLRRPIAEGAVRPVPLTVAVWLDGRRICRSQLSRIKMTALGQGYDVRMQSKLTRDDILRLLGPLSDHAVLEILATQPSFSDLEEVAMYLARENDVMGEQRRPLAGTPARIYEIVRYAEELPDDQDRAG